jgi:hypothetical protein
MTMNKAPHASASAHQRPVFGVTVFMSVPDTGGDDTGTAGPFPDNLVSLLVMTAKGQADARSSCRASR